MELEGNYSCICTVHDTSCRSSGCFFFKIQNGFIGNHSRMENNDKMMKQNTTYLPPSSKQHPIAQFVPFPLPYTTSQPQFSLPSTPIDSLIHPRMMSSRVLPSNLTPDLVRADKFLILIQNRPAETRFQDHDRREDEARADFNEGKFGIEVSVMGGCSRRFGRLGFVGRSGVGFGDGGGFADFEAADPDFVVGERETHDVVDEWFGFARAFGYTEYVCEEFLDYEEMRGGGEIRGKG